MTVVALPTAAQPRATDRQARLRGRLNAEQLGARGLERMARNPAYGLLKALTVASLAPATVVEQVYREVNREGPVALRAGGWQSLRIQPVRERCGASAGAVSGRRQADARRESRGERAIWRGRRVVPTSATTSATGCWSASSAEIRMHQT